MVNPSLAPGITTLLEVAGTLNRAADLHEQLFALHPNHTHYRDSANTRREQAAAHLAAAEALEAMN